MLFKIIASFAIGATTSFAYDFSTADALFADREQGIDKVNEARAEYQKALSSVSGDELVYAVQKMSRLDTYHGDLLPDGDNDSKKEIFGACLERLDSISPENVGETPEYYFFKATCLGLWAQANGVLESLQRTKELFGYLDKGENLEPTFEGGGFFRIRGAVYAKLPAFNPFGPAKDLKKSKNYLERAIASEAYPGSENPDTETGEYHYNNYYYYAVTLKFLGENEEAAAVLKEAIDRIEGGDLPVGREPETKVILGSLKKLRNS